MSVGDIESKEKGSGARYNDGKPDYSLILISDFAGHLQNVAYDDGIISILACLGRFQKTHDVYDLYAALSGCTYGDIEESAHVFTYGAKKYAAWNWTKGMNWSIPLACAVRHCMAIIKGEEVDPESNRKHIGHVICNIWMLIHYTKYYQEGNDLPSKELFK